MREIAGGDDMRSHVISPPCTRTPLGDGTYGLPYRAADPGQAAGPAYTPVFFGPQLPHPIRRPQNRYWPDLEKKITGTEEDWGDVTGCLITLSSELGKLRSAP